ncbi:coiled-coil domain-containing protein 116 [Rhinolophus ferrumequinum]|uniref:coiled-coil domain-containing protein 116 n=1 Tax=Rhinolophus ferrumequinum TaxID=59479 RepID=UPI00140F51B1|nr:coiled-coil domain-containing protein 116 [Rhinolophus ferrumequinum]
MTSCRHHSGYLADDEAGHTTYLARVQPPKKPAFPEMRQASKLGHMPHPPSKYSPSSALHKHHRNWRDPRPFGTFLDFLVKGQVLDSLQTVVDKATERIATMKTEAGVPLVEVQDPVEVPAGGRRVRARPSLSTMHRHLVRPSLCTGNPNNYPSCSSSMSDSHSNFTAGWHGSHSRDSDLGYNGLGPLPPMKDKLLQEKSLKRLLQLENRGKSLGQFCSQRDSLLWDSMGSQSSSQWTPEHPLLGFSSLLGSSLGTPEASELGPGKRELIFLKQEFNKEINSLLSQPASLDLPGYCSLREPHRTLDFLAEHHLFPALQRVVSQAVDKLSGACLHNGCPLFPSEWEPTTKPNLNSDSNSEVTPDSKWATTDQGEERYDYPLPTTASSLRMVHRKSTKSRGWDKPKEDVSSMSSDQEATRIRLKSHIFTKKKPLPSIASESTVSHFFDPRYEELVNYLMEQAVSLLVSKYKFERNLTKQLGFISFPVTETLMDLFLGFKKVKGSHIRLSSKVDWSCLLHKLEEAQWAGQVSRPVSQSMSLKASHHKASKRTTSHSGTTHHSTSQHSTESPSTLPKPATVVDQEVAAEPCLHTESLGPQLSTPQENSTAEEAVDMGESPSSENEEEETTTSLGVRDPESPQASRGDHSAHSPGGPNEVP